MEIEIMIPARDEIEWTDELAQTAIGKPLLERPGGDLVLGKITAARIDGDDLILRVSIHTAVDILLRPKPELRAAAIQPPAWPFR